MCVFNQSGDGVDDSYYSVVAKDATEDDNDDNQVTTIMTKARATRRWALVKNILVALKPRSVNQVVVS